MKKQWMRLVWLGLAVFTLSVAPVLAKSSSSGGSSRSSSSSSRSSSSSSGRSSSSSSSSKPASSSGFSSSGKSNPSSSGSSSSGASSSGSSSKPASSSGSSFSSSGKSPSSSSDSASPASGSTSKSPSASTASSSSSDSGSAASAAPASKPASSSSSGFSSSGASKSPTASSSSSSGDSTKSSFSSSGNSPASVKTATGVAATKTSLQKQADTSIKKERAQQSLNNYNAERQKYQAPPSTVASSPQTQTAVFNTMQSGAGSPRVVTINRYYTYRDDFYGRYNYSTPLWAYRSAPSFGMWDAMFLWFMLDNIHDRQYSSMYYHHQNDPAMQAWRREADNLARDNAELRAKLAALDSSQTQFANVPRDSSYLPQDVGVAALSSEKAEQMLAREKSGSSWLSVFFWMGVIGLSLTAVLGVVWAVLRFASPKKESATI